MNPDIRSQPQLFKGIALFTPGGDLIYSIDPNKQGRWHLHLCAALQEILDLSEPPHFLVPCYTATIDHWLDPRTQQVQTFAEAYPTVMRHQAILNTIFSREEIAWQVAPWQEGTCDCMVLATYRAAFPQLWEDHDLIIRLDLSHAVSQYRQPATDSKQVPVNISGYVLRLFVAGHNLATERILHDLHHLLERSLVFPYTLKVIDVLTHPEQAEINQVSATPTLVKVWPHPVRRIVGELDNVDRLLHILGAQEK
jgi:circadian clock protein KaiB